MFVSSLRSLHAKLEVSAHCLSLHQHWPLGACGSWHAVEAGIRCWHCSSPLMVVWCVWVCAAFDAILTCHSLLAATAEAAGPAGLGTCSMLFHALCQRSPAVQPSPLVSARRVAQTALGELAQAEQALGVLHWAATCKVHALLGWVHMQPVPWFPLPWLHDSRPLSLALCRRAIGQCCIAHEWRRVPSAGACHHAALVDCQRERGGAQCSCSNHGPGKRMRAHLPILPTDEYPAPPLSIAGASASSAQLLR